MSEHECVFFFRCHLTALQRLRELKKTKKQNIFNSLSKSWKWIDWRFKKIAYFCGRPENKVQPSHKLFPTQWWSSPIYLVIPPKSPKNEQNTVRLWASSYEPLLLLLLISKGLSALEALEVLRLSFNSITTIQLGELDNLRGLRELHLQHNLISSLHSDAFRHLQQLKVNKHMIQW